MTLDGAVSRGAGFPWCPGSFPPAREVGDEYRLRALRWSNLGAAQAGTLAALDEAGVRPDLIVGTSVGAVNGARIVGEGHVEGPLDVWLALRRGDVFPTRPLGGLLGFLGRSDHLVSDGGLRRLLRTHLRFSDLQDAAIPLHAAATAC